ncbi:hypothetical protein CR513_47290, partial [Mucuna pruriens]
MWKKNGGSRRRNHSKKFTKENKGKSKLVCYECKKPRVFKPMCLNLEKEKEKKPHFKKKKGLMETLEEFDLSPFEEEDEVNICLMDDTTSKDDENDEESGCRGRNFKKTFDDEEGRTGLYPKQKGLKHNLLSISQLCDSGFDVSFNNGECI